MIILEIDLGGPIPEMEGKHPQKFIEDLGVKVIEFRGSAFACRVAMEVNRLPERIPSCVEVKGSWPLYLIPEDV